MSSLDVKERTTHGFVQEAGIDITDSADNRCFIIINSMAADTLLHIWLPTTDTFQQLQHITAQIFGLPPDGMHLVYTNGDQPNPSSALITDLSSIPADARLPHSGLTQREFEHEGSSDDIRLPPDTIPVPNPLTAQAVSELLRRLLALSDFPFYLRSTTGNYRLTLTLVLHPIRCKGCQIPIPIVHLAPTSRRNTPHPPTPPTFHWRNFYMTAARNFMTDDDHDIHETYHHNMPVGHRGCNRSPLFVPPHPIGNSFCEERAAEAPLSILWSLWQGESITAYVAHCVDYWDPASGETLCGICGTDGLSYTGRVQLWPTMLPLWEETMQLLPTSDSTIGLVSFRSGSPGPYLSTHTSIHFPSLDLTLAFSKHAIDLLGGSVEFLQPFKEQITLRQLSRRNYIASWPTQGTFAHLLRRINSHNWLRPWRRPWWEAHLNTHEPIGM